MSRSYPTLRFRFFVESDLDVVTGGFAAAAPTASDIVPAESREAREERDEPDHTIERPITFPRRYLEEDDAFAYEALARGERVTSIESILAASSFSEEDTTAALLSVAFANDNDES